MTEPTWYYAENDEEKGPVERAELLRRLASGQLPADTLVWTEGMADWAPAENVDRLRILSPPAPPAGGPAATTLPAAPQWVGPFEKHLAFWQPAALMGLCLLLLSHGCMEVGRCGADRLEARAELAMADFTADAEAEMLAMQKKIDAMEEEDDVPVTEGRLERLEQARDELTQRREAYSKEKETFTAGVYQPLMQKATRATLDLKVWVYWYQMAFSIGLLMLGVALLVGTLCETGPVRWVALTLLAVVLLALTKGLPPLV